MEVVLAVVVLTKTRKKGPKLDFGPLYLENSPRYDIDICAIFESESKSESESESSKIGLESELESESGLE